MKRFIIFFVILSTLLITTTSAVAFTSQGNTNTSINYRDFYPHGNGYKVTLVNLSSQAKYNFYIIFSGFDYRRSEIYRKRIPVDLLKGGGDLSLYLPDFNDDIIYWKVEFEKLKEFDIHVRNP